MLTTIFLLIAGFALLITGANSLVNGSSAIARRMRISELVIGLTIVAFGTSTPELVVNIDAARNGLDDVVLGNVIGSNIFNLLLILGISGIIQPVVVQVQTVWKEIPVSLLGVVILWVLAVTGGTGSAGGIGRVDGLILLFIFILFMIYVFRSASKEEFQGGSIAGKAATGQESRAVHRPLILSMVMVVFGLGALIFGGNLVVSNSVTLAREFGMSEKLIGLTILSIGTSLPELATSALAALKGKSDLAIGNVVGSNIFNILMIIGISSLVSPVDYNPSFYIDLLVLGGSTLFVFLAMFSGKRQKLDRWESGLLLLGFFVYMGSLVV